MSEVVLENQTNRYYLTKQVLLLRKRSLVSASIFYAFFCLMDIVRFPSELYQVTLSVRILFFLLPIVILAIIYWEKDTDNQSVHLFWLSYLYLAVGLIHAFLVYWVAQYDLPFLDWGIILLILYGCLLTALPLKICSVISAVIIFSLAVSMYFADYSLVTVLFNSIVYLFFATLCIAVNRVCQNILKQNFSLIKRLHKESIFDGMTQLYNRAYFYQQLKLLLQVGCRDERDVGLIFLDVDHFKQFNDSKGHQKADDVLKLISVCLNTVCRRDSDFAARYGGDEFVLVFYGINKCALEKKSKEIIEAVAKLKVKHPSSSVSDYITVSLGATILSSNEEQTCPDAIKVADKNLYKAKEMGRNCFFMDSN